MNNLYAMNIYLYIFLVNIVANKERFFIKRTDNGKIVEFTLNVTTAGGGDFYNIIKETKTINTSMKYTDQIFYACTIHNMNSPFMKQVDYSINYPIGQIIGNQNAFSVIITELNSKYIFEKIGNINVTNQPEFNEIFDSTSPIVVEFQLVEEEDEIPKDETSKDETPKKTKELNVWISSKILKKIKALNRYRIVKRLKKMRALKNRGL